MSAPGKTRGINWWDVASTIAGIVMILLSIVGSVTILQQIAEH